MYLLHSKISKFWKMSFPFYTELAALTASPACGKIKVLDTILLLQVRLLFFQQ